MSARVTRSAAAQKAATTGAGLKKEADEAPQLASPPTTPAPSKKGRKSKPSKAKSPSKDSGKSPVKSPITPVSAKKRKRSTVKKEEEEDELPHNLGKLNVGLSVEESPKIEANSAKKRKPSSAKPELSKEDVKSMAAKVAAQSLNADAESPKKANKAKENNYGLKPGQTPFPDWPHPTAEECHEVVNLLSDLHGAVKQPKKIPLPSLTVSGCGEVPSVLDALIRTRLSAATSASNSSRAFQGLVSRFGTLKSGIGKGSVDWDAVRCADVKDIFKAIQSGGLADVKSKDIKLILQMVWEENQARRTALLQARKEDEAGHHDKSETAGPPGAEEEPAEEKNAEIERAEENVLSLDHIHLLSTDDAFAALTKYPGIGPKTASCVLLFCLQRPSFAVDTHVFRLCKWLGWAPPKKATRNSTYAHCEVRVPDDLKYPLHQLMIKHGRTCSTCKAPGRMSDAEHTDCPIFHLFKFRPQPKARKVTEKNSKEASGDESSELSELDDDEGVDGEVEKEV